jgi:hypothetical protein
MAIRSAVIAPHAVQSAFLLQSGHAGCGGRHSQISEGFSMTPHATHHYPGRTELPRWIIVGFLSGAASVLIFHQGLAALLYAWELTPRAPYALEPTRPFGIPLLWSITFWGGVWGAVLAATLGRLDGAPLIIAATLFGALLPTLVAWFIVASLKGQPATAGGAPMAMAIGVILNAAWGLGTGLGIALFGRSHVHKHS